ncbi:hypothetical protein D3C87_1628330 [compost metagenome]
MIDALETAAGYRVGQHIEVGAVDVGVLVHQINQAAVRRTHRGKLQFIGTDQSAIGLTFIGHGPGQRAGAVLDPHGGGAQRRPVGFEKTVAERVRLRVEDQVDIALAQQADAL